MKNAHRVLHPVRLNSFTLVGLIEEGSRIKQCYKTRTRCSFGRTMFPWMRARQSIYHLAAIRYPEARAVRKALSCCTPTMGRLDTRSIERKMESTRGLNSNCTVTVVLPNEVYNDGRTTRSHQRWLEQLVTLERVFPDVQFRGRLFREKVQPASPVQRWCLLRRQTETSQDLRHNGESFTPRGVNFRLPSRRNVPG